jgi:DNA-binding beta-propeller fold protein YncE
MSLPHALEFLMSKHHAILARVFAPALAILIPFALLLLVFGGTIAAQSQGTLLVAEKGAQSLALIDPATGHVLASIPEGGITGHEVAASKDGHYAYVPIYGNSGVGKPGTDGSTMVTIDIPARKVVSTFDFHHGVRPHCPVVGPDNLLYVTTELDNTVSIFDLTNPADPKLVGSIPTGSVESHLLALSHDGRFGYTANVGPGTVSVLDIKARKLIAVIPLSKQVQRMSVSMDDKMAFTSDQTKPQLAVIDTASNKLKTWIPLPSPGYGTAPTPDGRWLLVCITALNKVAVIDLQSMKVAKTIDVPAEPQAVLVRPDNAVAYISCDKTNQVAELNLKSWTITRRIFTGKLADGLAWAPAK